MKIKYETAKKPYYFLHNNKKMKEYNEEGYELELAHQTGATYVDSYKEIVELLCNITKSSFEIKIIKKIKDNYFIAVKLNDKIYCNFTATEQYSYNFELDKENITHYKKLCTQEEFNIAKDLLSKLSKDFLDFSFKPLIELTGKELEAKEEEICTVFLMTMLSSCKCKGLCKFIINNEEIINYQENDNNIGIYQNKTQMFLDLERDYFYDKLRFNRWGFKNGNLYDGIIESKEEIPCLKKTKKHSTTPSDGATSRNSAKVEFKNPVLKEEAKVYDNPLRCISKRTFFCIMLVLFSVSLWAMIFIPSTHWILNKIFFFAKGDVKLIFMFLLFAGSIAAVNVSGYYDLEKIRKEEKELKK